MRKRISCPVCYEEVLIDHIPMAYRFRGGGMAVVPGAARKCLAWKARQGPIWRVLNRNKTKSALENDAYYIERKRDGAPGLRICDNEN